MKKKGLVIKQMSEDGACLFRAIADQVYGDQDMHDIVRKNCMDYLVSTTFISKCNTPTRYLNTDVKETS